MSRVFDAIRAATLVVAVGSVDGVLTAAAVKRLSGRPDLEVVFTQAFQVDQLPVSKWEGRRVVFVDLAVNNRDPKMTKDFVASLQLCGADIIAIIDEHDREEWARVLDADLPMEDEWGDEVASLSFIWDRLAVRPQTRVQSDPATPQSSGEVLRRALVAEGVKIDAHTDALLAAANAADKMDFSPEMADTVNRAVKSAIGDNRRRVHLVDLLAAGPEVDGTVRGWIAEYEEMEANAARLLAEAVEDLGDGIVRVDTGGAKLDVTSFLFALYKRARVVVITGATAYRPELGQPGPVVFVATGDKTLDLLAVVKAAGVAAGGMPGKATIDPKAEGVAIEAIRAVLTA